MERGAVVLRMLLTAAYAKTGAAVQKTTSRNKDRSI